MTVVTVIGQNCSTVSLLLFFDQSQTKNYYNFSLSVMKVIQEGRDYLIRALIRFKKKVISGVCKQ